MRQYFRVIVVVYAILELDDQVLLIRRKNTGYNDGNYSLPAGHHDGGETLVSAAVREVKEEVGVQVTLADMRLAHVMHKDSPDGERICVFFTCRQWTGEPKNMESDKCDEVVWRSFDDLPVNLVKEVRDVLEAYKRGELYSDRPIGESKLANSR